MRILTFHTKDAVGNNARIGPTYYIEGDYSPLAVRVHAENAPVSDAKIDIFDDGVSIFSNRTSTAHHQTTGADITGDAVTAAVLAEGENSDEIAEDFNDNPIKEGSWVYCEVVDSGGGKNFTVHLEMEDLTNEL